MEIQQPEQGSGAKMMMDFSIELVKQRAKGINAHVIANRRHLHAHPELSFEEVTTAAFVAKKLSAIGLSPERLGATGITATIRGDLPTLTNKMVVLRADMDALPIAELNQLDYASKTPGVMHACGHDAHTASLLGVAEILVSLKHVFAGTIKFLFQPAEEKIPGGAAEMVKAGVLVHDGPVSVIGQHVFPALMAGQVGIRAGKCMASMDEITLTIYGKGGHGAQPHVNVDPVLIAAQVLVGLQQIVSRVNDPISPAVLSFGRFIADGAFNVIPDRVDLQGTFRTFDEKARFSMHDRIRTLAIGMTESMGGRCEVTINAGYPHLVNAEELTERLKKYMEEFLGTEQVRCAEPWMAAEDFAYYSHAADSCFYFLGTAGPAYVTRFSLHSPNFDIDESALLTGSGLMAYLAIRELME